MGFFLQVDNPPIFYFAPECPGGFPAFETRTRAFAEGLRAPWAAPGPAIATKACGGQLGLLFSPYKPAERTNAGGSQNGGGTPVRTRQIGRIHYDAPGGAEMDLE